jgi:putative transposase
LKVYRFRLYPTEAQKQVLSSTLETCRHLFNDSLGERRADWDVGYWEQQNLLPFRKQQNKFYKQVHSQVLQDVLQRLDKAYESFFKKLARYPNFKEYGKYNSFTYPQYGGWKMFENKLVLSHIGAIKFRMHRIPVGTLKRCTIIRDVDQWYCCITVDDGVENQTKSCDKSKPVGIDVGLLNWLALSDRKKIQNSMNVEAQTRRIKQLQIRLSRKEKGSHNREKARILLAKEWRNVRRRREDFCHKLSKKLAYEYDRIVFEKLNITGMVRNHSLAQAIMDATWGKLRLYTTYKVERRGGQTIVVNPTGTSQKCSRCGVGAKEKLDLPVRIFECWSCGLVIDRDVNAALNILQLGLEQTHAETEPLLIKRISKFQSRKQESHVFRRG